MDRLLCLWLLRYTHGEVRRQYAGALLPTCGSQGWNSSRSLALEPSLQPSFDRLRYIGLCVFVYYVKKFGNSLKSGLSPKQSPLSMGRTAGRTPGVVV